MDRRVFLAVVLTAIVIVVTPLLFPSGSQSHLSDSVAVDSIPTGVAAGNQETNIAQAVGRTPRNTTPKAQPKIGGTERMPFNAGDSLSVESGHMIARYANIGATPMDVVLKDYQSGDRAKGRSLVVLHVGPGRPLVRYDLTIGDSSIALADVNFVGSVGDENGAPTARFNGNVLGDSVSVTYTSPRTDAERYLIHAVLTVQGSHAARTLSIEMPGTLASAETDTADDIRHLAFGYMTRTGDVVSLPFAKLDTGTTKNATGPIQWAAVRNKYFLVAILSPDSAISGVAFGGEPQVQKLKPEASGRVSLPIQNGRVAFDLYVGPQEFARLRSIGHGLDQVNPYAGWLHGLVQPFATIVTMVLLQMKRTSGLSYGWVIIIFGVLVRLLLWPLNQSAMRTSIRMQRIQPELTETQKKYKNDPRKQQEALVKLYQAHGMTPFSPMMGCLPMLLPMPILFALYFVFLNTIEFRGVSFLWMRDISAADPYYITPLIMGASMFVLSWIGMRGTPPNAQTRTMGYMMPLVFTFMFFRFAAGLNLYYAVQNIAALPQQWLLSQERAGAGTKNVVTARGEAG